MLNCNTCIVGITMLFSSVYLTILKQDKSIFTDFIKLLDDEQKIKYHKIVKERLTAYVLGMVLGVVVAYIIIVRIQKKNISYVHS